MRYLLRSLFLFSILVINSFCVFSADVWPKELNGQRKIESTITIKTPEKTIRYRRSDLIARGASTSSSQNFSGDLPANPSPKPGLTILKVEKDPAYGGRSMAYEAVPVYSLFKGIDVPKGGVLQYRCLDGFSAAISMERLLNSSPEKSIAYLAIEPERKWPQLPDKRGGQTAGPFYVIWSNPEASQINREEWPYQVVGFEVKKSLQDSYPDIFPDPALSESSAIRNGFKVFAQVCFNCHTMNLQGESHIGPDLNYPMSPTEYFKDGVLQNFVRDPKSVRQWPNAAMPAFPVEVVSDPDMENLVQYFKHMSTRKVKSPQ